jgi:hypothetical protein
MSQQACSLDAVANGTAYRRMMQALEKGDLEQADKQADELYFEILNTQNAHMALQWKQYWDDVKSQRKVDETAGD